MIIFVRNGENNNKQQEFQSPIQKAEGYLQLGLSENGEKQAFKRAKEIKTLIHDYCNEVDLEPKEINITICSSPFQKCLETAQIIKTNIQDHEIKMKKKKDIIYTQIELGDYRHPFPTKKEEIEKELHDFAYSYLDITKEKFIDKKYLTTKEYLLYQNDTEDTERQRIANFFNELVYKQENKQKTIDEIFIVVTHRFALEIIVDIFDGDQKICESGLIAIKNNLHQDFQIYRVGEVFRMEKQE